MKTATINIAEAIRRHNDRAAKLIARDHGLDVPLQVRLDLIREETTVVSGIETERDELIQALEEMVGRHLGDRSDVHFAIGDNLTDSDAIRVLAKHGRLQIVDDDGRHRVTGRWVA